MSGRSLGNWNVLSQASKLLFKFSGPHITFQYPHSNFPKCLGSSRPGLFTLPGKHLAQDCLHTFIQAVPYAKSLIPQMPQRCLAKKMEIFLFSETSVAYRMPLSGIIWILPSGIICIHNVIRILQSRNFTVQVTCICLAQSRCFINKLEQSKHSVEVLWKVLKDKRSFGPKDLPTGTLGLLDE